MKRIALAITAMFFVAGCGWFGSPEAYKSESGRTTFRAANQRPAESEATPAPQKIPGESTRP
ncbi:MAG TPA: membrane lipoprotein lipid attachment site-containing protein [Chthoniobacterales bacterium]|nr:membrane lipoprotein lipid attachment site-containing protein [Chthoniobacterales bacterium]